MKSKSAFCLFLFIFVFCPSKAQVPKGFNYMAIARNESGEILARADLSIRIAILKSSVPLIYAWEEEHVVKTDDFGQFKLIVGDPAAVWTEPPGSVERFTDIDWNIQPLYIRTSIFIKDVWEVMGDDAQLFSVPYSLVSQNLSGANKLSVAGTTTNMDEALFEVKNHLDQTVFAVYGDGVRMYVGDRTAKGAKGGFAIGEFGAKGKTDIQEYFTITPYEARINMNPPLPGKAPKGGFAIGEFGAKGLIPTNFMDVTPKNYFIGHESGTLIADGLYNSVVGYQAGKNLISGLRNTIFGNQAGFSVSSGDNNILMGDAAGFSLNTGNHNTLIGSGSGYNHTNQEYNIMIGTAAGFNVNSLGWNGSFNTFIGINAGYKIKTSKENTLIGTNAGYMLESGTGNTIVGIDAGRGGPDDPSNYYGYTTSRNTMLGNMSGYNLLSGSGNVFIGYQAGYFEEGSIVSPIDNKLYISNSSTNNIIYGDFSTGNIGIGTTTLTRKLNVTGDIGVSGDISANSVNNMKIGKIYMTAEGYIETAFGNTYKLYWLKATGEIYIYNTSLTDKCEYWYRTQYGSTTGGNSGSVNANTNAFIIPGIFTNNSGIEVHFGSADGQEGWCSVWLQYANNCLVGHYIKY